jgi:flagellar biosynthesis/type III secretory pathway chaperone
MQNPLEQLIKSLERMAALYDEALVLVLREKEAALASDIKGLMAATDEKHRLLAKIKEVDHGRNQLIGQLAGALGLPPAKLSLLALAARVEPRDGRRLQRIYNALAAKIEKLRQANKESRLLFQHCLNLVQNSLSFFNYWTKNTAVYGSSGTMNSGVADKHLVSSSA